MMTNSPLASLAKQHGINFNPNSQKGLLKHAANRVGTGATTQAAANENPEGIHDP